MTLNNPFAYHHSMVFSPRTRFLALFLIGSVFASICGLLLGLAFGVTINIQNNPKFGEYTPALPSQVLDINGEVITEFFSEEKREIISYVDVPRHLINALTIREDREFFQHGGFSFRGTFRALSRILSGQGIQGGSTLTQQLAGKLYSDRRELSVKRKLVELWWALQLESRYSKQELLERYMNNMPLGHNTYGFEAASKYFFRHSVKQATLAESVLLVIQLVKPTHYSPIRHPTRAQKIQKEILSQMAQAGYVTEQEAEKSFQDYWSNYDYQRDNLSTAFFDRKDKAPFFSEYIRQLLDSELTGTTNIYKDGLTVHTTLDLNYQALADKIMSKGIAATNARYHANHETRFHALESELQPMLELFSLALNMPDLKATRNQYLKDAREYVITALSPTLDILAKLFGLQELESTAQIAYQPVLALTSKTQVEGALITLENSTGYVKAMIGGSQFSRENQLNRAMLAKVQAGSVFKPLFYSAAIDSRKFTPATMILDEPTVFYSEDGTPYTPQNFKGRWKGPILLRQALAQSLNIPAIQVLASIGFDAAIDRATRLLGVSDPGHISADFPRRYPLALGVCSVSPIQIARAYAIFGNQGRVVDPITILYVQDRKGNIIANPAADTLSEQRRRGSDAQIVNPQTAYIMTDILKTAVASGTLAWSSFLVDGLGMKMAGKTGTTQNWSDAWAVGFSPYMTTAIWLGFDKPGNSLGLNNTGATAAGPLWAEYMKEVHKDLPPLNFSRPSGIRNFVIDAETGLLPSGDPGEKTINEIFLEGTEPTEISNLVQFRQLRDESLQKNIKNMLETIHPNTVDLNPKLDLDLDFSQ